MRRAAAAPRAMAAQAAPVDAAPRADRRKHAGARDQQLSTSWWRLPASKRDLQIKLALERDVRLVRCEDGKLEIALEPGAAKTLVNDLSRKLQQWTGQRWMVVVSREPGAADAEIAGRRAQGRA